MGPTNDRAPFALWEGRTLCGERDEVPWTTRSRATLPRRLNYLKQAWQCTNLVRPLHRSPARVPGARAGVWQSAFRALDSFQHRRLCVPSPHTAPSQRVSDPRSDLFSTHSRLAVCLCLSAFSARSRCSTPGFASLLSESAHPRCHLSLRGRPRYGLGSLSLLALQLTLSRSPQAAGGQSMSLSSLHHLARLVRRRQPISSLWNVMAKTVASSHARRPILCLCLGTASHSLRRPPHRPPPAVHMRARIARASPMSYHIIAYVAPSCKPLSQHLKRPRSQTRHDTSASVEHTRCCILGAFIKLGSANANPCCLPEQVSLIPLPTSTHRRKLVRLSQDHPSRARSLRGDILEDGEETRESPGWSTPGTLIC